VDGVVAPMLRLIAELDPRAAAFVIACFSDPGLHSARETTRRPVLGIMECGILTALTLGQRFGVIAILATSIPRHLRTINAMGLSSRLANERAVGLPVVELADESKTSSRMIEVGRALAADGANSIVMGCAGMAQYRDRVEQAAGVPVVEPTQAAVAMAIGRVRLGW
jgi:Asp/Glu/hydantoin racemase